MPLEPKSQTVTIDSNNKGTATFSINGFVMNVFVEPSPGTAVNTGGSASIVEAWSRERTAKAAAALGTASMTDLWTKEGDGILTVSSARDLEVRFTGGTDGEAWAVHLDLLEVEW